MSASSDRSCYCWPAWSPFRTHWAALAALKLIAGWLAWSLWCRHCFAVALVLVLLVLLVSMAVTPFLNNAATGLLIAPSRSARQVSFRPDSFLMAWPWALPCDFLTPSAINATP